MTRRNLSKSQVRGWMATTHSSSSARALVAAAAAAIAALTPALRAAPQISLDPAQFGQWAGPYELSQVTLGCVPAGSVHHAYDEVGHAILLPPRPDAAWPQTGDGPHVGKVVLFSEQGVAPPHGCNNVPITAKTHRVWIVNPEVVPPRVTTIDVDPNVVTSDIFCSGVVTSPQGKLVVFGGADCMAPPRKCYFFDPNPDPQQTPLAWFASLPSIAQGSFYPSGMIDALGRVVVAGGRAGGHTCVGNKISNWQVLDPLNPVQWNPFVPTLVDKNGSPVTLGGVGFYEFDYFPRMVSSGADLPGVSQATIFVANDCRGTSQANPAASYTYRSGPFASPADRLEIHEQVTGLNPPGPPSEWYFNNTVVMVRHPDLATPSLPMERVYSIGGSNPAAPTATALTKIYECSNLLTGEWLEKTDMQLPRVWSSSIVTPTGDIVILGGATNDTINYADPGGGPIHYAVPVYAAESFTPAPVGAQQTAPSNLAAMTVPRIEHSCALLLRDGRIFVVGGVAGPDEATPVEGYTGVPPDRSCEIYSPRYLFQGPRPLVSLPATQPREIPYGGTYQFNVTSNDAITTANTRVVLIRGGSSTHATDFEQRYVEMKWSIQTSTHPDYVLSVEGIPTGRRGLAPPGWYMLFVVGPNGVPSVGEFVQIPV